MIKAIIFDLFGVLTTDALSSIVTDLKVTDSDKAEHIIKLVAAASRGLIEPGVSRAAVADELGITLDEYSKRIKNGEIRNQQLLNYIKKLRPHYKTALLSNVISGGIDVRFSREELTMYFDVVVASGDIGYAKPEARAYEITADKLGIRLNECIFIDDIQRYCDGAEAVGMRAILYKSVEELKSELNRVLADSNN